MRYIIVTGQSGAGKTACVRYLEDKGSFCMDNMPPMLLPKLIDHIMSGRINPKEIITHRLPLEKIGEASDLLVDHPDQSLGVILTMKH